MLFVIKCVERHYFFGRRGERGLLDWWSKGKSHARGWYPPWSFIGSTIAGSALLAAMYPMSWIAKVAIWRTQARQRKMASQRSWLGQGRCIPAAAPARWEKIHQKRLPHRNAWDARSKAHRARLHCPH